MFHMWENDLQKLSALTSNYRDTTSNYLPRHLFIGIYTTILTVIDLSPSECYKCPCYLTLKSKSNWSCFCWLLQFHLIFHLHLIPCDWCWTKILLPLHANDFCKSVGAWKSILVSWTLALTYCNYLKCTCQLDKWSDQRCFSPRLSWLDKLSLK